MTTGWLRELNIIHTSHVMDLDTEFGRIFECTSKIYFLPVLIYFTVPWILSLNFDEFLKVLQNLFLPVFNYFNYWYAKKQQSEDFQNGL